MSRNLTDEYLLALSEGYLYPALFLEIYFASGPLRISTWNQDQIVNGVVFSGAGNLLQFSTIEDGSEVLSRGISVSLSGFDPTLIPLVLDDFQPGLPATIYFGLFAGEGLGLVGNTVIAWQGKTDQPTITVSPDSATIEVALESILADMNVPVPWRYTQGDQQKFYPGDLGFSFVTSIQSIPIYWGQNSVADGNP